MKWTFVDQPDRVWAIQSARRKGHFASKPGEDISVVPFVVGALPRKSTPPSRSTHGDGFPIKLRVMCAFIEEYLDLVDLVSCSEIQDRMQLATNIHDLVAL